MVSHDRIELRRRMAAYAIRVAMPGGERVSSGMTGVCVLLLLLLHFPHMLQTALQVAAPQHDAPKVAI